jgi:hypothetical protein
MQYNTEKVKNLFNKSDEQIIERILTLKQMVIAYLIPPML